QEEICSIASGAVESTVKQIDRRLKISGAQWNEENIPQVLKHRCAYLTNSLELLNSIYVLTKLTCSLR
ncbi:MAG: hypothetical protein ACK5UO_17315, partial [Microcystis sp.]